MKKAICPVCGTIVQIDEETINESTDWLPCLLPTNFEWKLPAGKIQSIIGETVYISADGLHLSRDQYIEKYNIDPELALKNMRKRR